MESGNRRPFESPTIEAYAKAIGAALESEGDSLLSVNAEGGEVSMTQTGWLPSKTGKRFLRVEFTRKGLNGTDTAEGIIPGEKILKSSGFTDQEIASLELYLHTNKEDIAKRADELSNPLHWFG